MKSLLEKDFDCLLFSDWKADSYEGDLNLLREKGKVLVVDHHPLNEKLKNKSGIIKTESKYCSSHCLFDLAKEKNYFDFKDWEWLVCSAIITDYTFDVQENFDFLKSVYPEINKDKIFESIPGKIGKKIDNAINYYRPDIRKVFDLVLKKDLDSLDKVNEIVEEDIRKTEKKYLTEAEYFPEKNFYFGFLNPKIARISSVISKISHENPDKIFIIVSDSGSNTGLVKVSSRCQSDRVNLGKLLEKCTEGFENTASGGHQRAAGSGFPKKYLEEFKKRILENL